MKYTTITAASLIGFMLGASGTLAASEVRRPKPGHRMDRGPRPPATPRRHASLGTSTRASDEANAESARVRPCTEFEERMKIRAARKAAVRPAQAPEDAATLASPEASGNPDSNLSNATVETLANLHATALARGDEALAFCLDVDGRRRFDGCMRDDRTPHRMNMPTITPMEPVEVLLPEPRTWDEWRDLQRSHPDYFGELVNDTIILGRRELGGTGDLRVHAPEPGATEPTITFKGMPAFIQHMERDSTGKWHLTWGLNLR